MRVAVSGSSGLLGSAFLGWAAGQAWEPLPLPRPSFDHPRLADCDAVVHLAGEPLAAHRWTAAVRARIHDSRVEGTRRLVDGLARLPRRPRVLVCASAVGYYGDCGDEAVTEGHGPGDDFLARVCVEWEGEAARARELGLRVVSLRFGMILSPSGGALKAMLGPFRLGLGGPVGGGRQFWSFVALPDAVAALAFALSHEDLEGACNVAAPGALRQGDFAAVLGHHLRRPAFMPLPAVAARIVMGDLADAVVLPSIRAVPARLTSAGFTFACPDLAAALAAVL